MGLTEEIWTVMLICKADNEEMMYGKVTAAADPEVRPKCPHFLGFIFFSRIFMHSEKY